MKPEEKLESLLRARKVPNASGDFAARIILASHAVEQQGALSITEWLTGVFEVFRVPLLKPAYAVACTLLLGFVIGFASPAQEAQAQDIFFDEGSVL